MNQQPDDMLRQFWQDSKKEVPSDFADFIMQHLPEHSPLPEALKKPLLSPKVAVMLVVLVILLAVLVNLLSSGSTNSLPWYLNMEKLLPGSIDISLSFLPTLAVLSAAVALLVGLDRLLQRYAQPRQQ